MPQVCSAIDFVIRHLAERKVADFRELPEAERTISDHDLRLLLSRDFLEHRFEALAGAECARCGVRFGVRIAHAVVTSAEECINLDHVEAAFPVVMHDCTFPKKLSLRYASFDALDLDRSTTRSIDAMGMHVRGELSLSAGFRSTGTVRLINAQIDGRCTMIDARFELRYLPVDSDARPHGVTEWPVETDDWKDEQIKPTGSVDACGMKLGGSLYLDRSLFYGMLTLRGAEIAGRLYARRTTLVAAFGTRVPGIQVETANLLTLEAYGVKIRGSVHLNKGFMSVGTIRLAGAELQRKLSLKEAHLFELSAMFDGETRAVFDEVLLARAERAEEKSATAIIEREWMLAALRSSAQAAAKRAGRDPEADPFVSLREAVRAEYWKAFSELLPFGAMDAFNSRVRGSVYLFGTGADLDTRFIACGRITFQGARIDGRCLIENAELWPTGAGDPVFLENVEPSETATLHKISRAFEGTGVRVAKDILLVPRSVSNAEGGNALGLRGEICLSNSRIEGRIDLRTREEQAKEQPLREVRNPWVFIWLAGVSLWRRLGRSLYYSDMCHRSITMLKWVWPLRRCRHLNAVIRGPCDAVVWFLRKIGFFPPKEPERNAKPESRITALLNLRGAHAATFAIHDTFESVPLELEEFSWDRFHRPVIVEYENLRWFQLWKSRKKSSREDAGHGRSGFHPQPYVQLSQVLTAQGNMPVARAARIDLNREYRRSLHVRSVLGKPEIAFRRAKDVCTNWILDVTMVYGYRPSRILFYFAVLWIGASVWSEVYVRWWCDSDRFHALVPRHIHVASLDAAPWRPSIWEYAADSVLPLNFHVSENWRLISDFAFVDQMLFFVSLLTWFITGFVAAFAAGLVKRLE